jgi:hypothetical protein
VVHREVARGNAPTTRDAPDRKRWRKQFGWQSQAVQQQSGVEPEIGVQQALRFPFGSKNKSAFRVTNANEARLIDINARARNKTGKAI